MDNVETESRANVYASVIMTDRCMVISKNPRLLDNALGSMRCSFLGIELTCKR
jgi:hypothetical protein